MDAAAGPTVRVQVLGPLRAWRRARELSLGPAQRRVILGVLVLQRNRPIGRDQLVDAVWGEQPPTYAVNLLQQHIAQLRRILEPDRAPRTPARVLMWTETGYLLRLPPDGLDLAEFELERARGRAARAADDLATAAEAMHAASRLCKGAVCEGLASPLLDRERARLAEQLFEAALDRIEVDLALRPGSELIDQAQRLVDDNPLSERAHALLMSTLHRIGRRAQALAAYRSAYRVLRDELGVEPGARLKDLHRRILDAETVAEPGVETVAVDVDGAQPVEIDVLTATQAHRRPPDPHQLPAPPRSFTGRAEEIARLDALTIGDGAASTVIISAVSGTAGVGKTALAVHWAHRASDRFPDGQLYVNLRGFAPAGSAMDPAEAVRGILDALGVPAQRVPVSFEAQTALYRSLLSGRRILLVIDNARDADQVRPLLPGSPTVTVVVTSRSPLHGLIAVDGAYPMTLDLLTSEECQQLLTHNLGLGRVAAEPDAVDAIITRCARLPLALTIAAARAAVRPRFPLAALADELNDSRDRLDVLTGGDVATDIRAAFSSSLRILSADAVQLFALLSLHPGPDFAVATAADIAGLPVPRIRRTLQELDRANLISEHHPSRYTFHDLLRAYAAEQMDTHDKVERGAALRRMFDHYVYSAHAARLQLYGEIDCNVKLPNAQPGLAPVAFNSPADARAWFIAEHSNLVAAVHHAAHTGFDTHVGQITWGVGRFLDQQRQWRDWLAIESLALDAAQRLADRPAQALAHRGLAPVHARLDHHAEAHTHFRATLDLYREFGSAVDEARSLLNIAWMLVVVEQGRYEEALGYIERGLDLYRQADHWPGEARALHLLGECSSYLGDHPQALNHCRRALAIYQGFGNVTGQKEALGGLSDIYRALGDHRHAATCARQALSLCRETSDPDREAKNLTRLGDIHHADGNLQDAHDAWQQALTVLDDLDHPDAEQIRTKLHLATHDERTPARCQ